MRILSALIALFAIPAAAQTTSLASAAFPIGATGSAPSIDLGTPAADIAAHPWPDLAGANPAEQRAQTLWNLRAAMNVAALQCQFSPFLRTVKRWNWINQQHAREFLGAQTVIQGYFRKRSGTARASTAMMDQWNTRLWQSYAGAERQLGFCEAAAAAEQDLLVQPVGKVALLAAPELAAVREGMSAVPPAPTLAAVVPFPETEQLSSIDEGRKRRR